MSPSAVASLASPSRSVADLSAKPMRVSEELSKGAESCSTYHLSAAELPV